MQEHYAPENLTVNTNWWGIFFNWDDVTQIVHAKKYSVDVEGCVWYKYWYTDWHWDCPCVEVSMGTSDWNCDMTDSHLWMWKSNFASLLADAIYDETGIYPDFISGFCGQAKVKALAPKTDKGRQNNPFSDPAYFCTWLFKWID